MLEILFESFFPHKLNIKIKFQINFDVLFLFASVFRTHMSSLLILNFRKKRVKEIMSIIKKPPSPETEVFISRYRVAC